MEREERFTDESELPYVQKTVGNISLQDLFPSVRSKYNKNNIIIYNKKAAMYLTIG